MKYSQGPQSERRWSIPDVGLVGFEPRKRGHPGWVYFIGCPETERCKIGHTKGDVQKRLKALQTGASSKLRLLAAQFGSSETERELHEKFSSHRAHGEWFEMHDELFAYVTATIWVMSNIYADRGMALDEWMKVGLRMMADGMTEVPDELMALTLDVEPA